MVKKVKIEGAVARKEEKIVTHVNTRQLCSGRDLSLLAPYLHFLSLANDLM